MMLPTACREGLAVRDLPNETVVYDLKRKKVHCLNRTAALVWRHCDGRRTLAELALVLQREMAIPADETVIRLTLEQLERRHLLELPLAAESLETRRSRRDALKKLGLSLAALPVIMSLTAPQAAAQASKHAARPPAGPSCFPNGHACASGPDCCSGFCNDGTCGPPPA
jgi:hypothetical protein